MSPRTEQVSIYLRYISGGVTKETFIGYSLRPSKTGTALVHYYFFSLAGPRDKQVVFAIRAKLGLTPKWMFARTPMGGCQLSRKKALRRCTIRFNVISITRGLVGVKFPGKKRYVTLEWPLCYIPWYRCLYVIYITLFYSADAGTLQMQAVIKPQHRKKMILCNQLL